MPRRQITTDERVQLRAPTSSNLWIAARKAVVPSIQLIVGRPKRITIYLYGCPERAVSMLCRNRGAEHPCFSQGQYLTWQLCSRRTALSVVMRDTPKGRMGLVRTVESLGIHKVTSTRIPVCGA